MEVEKLNERMQNFHDETERPELLEANPTMSVQEQNSTLKNTFNALSSEKKKEYKKLYNFKMIASKLRKSQVDIPVYTGKTLIPIVYDREEKISVKISPTICTKPGGTVLVNFKSFFENITYKSSVPFGSKKGGKVTQISAGIRTCNCVYVFKKPIKYKEGKSNKLEHTPSTNNKREFEAYDVAAVNLIFGKFVKRRIEEKKMVKNDISENNKNALFLLAVEVYDTDNFTKYCESHSEDIAKS